MAPSSDSDLEVPGSTIPDARAAADDLLLAACSKTLQRLGAEVRIRADGENLVRALRDGPEFAARAELPVPANLGPDDAFSKPWPVELATGQGPIALVEASGLPNLLHELVHVALAGRLADDHGIDYQAIPFDLASMAGRAVLWDELAACVVSCAYLRTGSRDGDDWVVVDGWFDEQLGIQPVFYGMEDEPERFWSMLPRLVAEHSTEHDAMIDCAYDRVATLLARGAGYERTPARLSFDMLWQRRGSP